MKGTKFLSSKAILGIVTAVAVVVTVAGSFAAWDTLSATNTSGAVTIRKPVTVTTTGTPTYSFSNNYDTTLVENTAPTLTSEDIAFTVDGYSKLTSPTLTIKADLYNGETAVNANDYIITIQRKSAGETYGTAFANNTTDSGFTADGIQTYKVIVTFTNSEDADNGAYLDQSLTIRATASLGGTLKTN